MFIIVVEVIIKGEESEHQVVSLLSFQDNLHLTSLFGNKLSRLHNYFVLLDTIGLEKK